MNESTHSIQALAQATWTGTTEMHGNNTETTQKSIKTSWYPKPLFLNFLACLTLVTEVKQILLGHSLPYNRSFEPNANQYATRKRVTDRW